jgi:hypothetical protein
VPLAKQQKEERMTVAAKITEAYPKAAPIVDGIIALGAALGVHPYFIANVIEVESNFNPQARNARSGATGLIQFTPTIAGVLGTTTDKLKLMGIKEQFQYVVKYFMQYQGRIKTQAEVYMAVFQPGRLGQPLSTPLSAKAQEKNPTIRTLQDYVDKANARVKLPTTGSLPAPALVPVEAPPPAPDAAAEAANKRKRAKARAKARARNRKKKLLLVAGVGVGVTLLVGIFAYFVNRPLLYKGKTRELGQ